MKKKVWVAVEIELMDIEEDETKYLADHLGCYSSVGTNGCMRRTGRFNILPSKPEGKIRWETEYGRSVRGVRY